jgi:hypothetical protein
LADHLQRINLPVDIILCNDLCCRNNDHYWQINAYANEITNACITAAEATLPSSLPRGGGGGSGRIPGWSEYVQPLREKSLFWHQLWVDGGRPRSGVVADIMRRTRASYHYALRNVRRNEDAIVRNRLADALLNDTSRDFWSEIKRLRGSKCKLSGTIDGLTDATDIAQLFASGYKELCTSVPYNKGDMQDITDDLNVTLGKSPITRPLHF